MTSGGRHVGTAFNSLPLADEDQNRLAGQPVEGNSSTQANPRPPGPISAHPVLYPALSNDTCTPDVEATSADHAAELLKGLVRDINNFINLGTVTQFDEVLDLLLEATGRARKLGDQAKKRLEDSKGEVDRYHARAVELQATVNALEANVGQARELGDQAEKELEDSKGKLDRCRAQAVESQATVNALEEQATSLEAKVRRARELNEQAEKQLEDSGREVDRYRAQAVELQANVNALTEQATKLEAKITRQSRKQDEEHAKLDRKRDEVKQLMERWSAQNEDQKRRQVEIDKAKQASDTVRRDLEALREQLQRRHNDIYAERKAVERAQESIEQERQTVVTFARGLEESVLKKDPAYVPVEIEDDKIVTDTISAALVERFNDMTIRLRDEVSARDAIRVRNTNISEELADLKKDHRHKAVKIESLEGQNRLLQEEQHAKVKDLEGQNRFLQDQQDAKVKDLEGQNRLLRDQQDVIVKNLEGQNRLLREQQDVEVKNLEDQNRLLREQQDVDLKAQEDLEATLRLTRDRIRIGLEREETTRIGNEGISVSLRETRLERDELQRLLTDSKETNSQLHDQRDELLHDIDTVKEDHRQRGERLAAEETKSAELQQQVSDISRAREAANRLTATLQGKYDQICEELKVLKASEVTRQKEFDEERAAHDRTKGAYSELDKRMATAGRDTHSARHEVNQLTIQHASSQLRVQQLQIEVQELAEWKEKMTASLSRLTAIETDKERLETENHTLRAERDTLKTDLEAKQIQIGDLEAQAGHQRILSDAAGQREEARDRTIESLRNSIALLRQPRTSEHLAEGERKLIDAMGELATSMFNLLTSRQGRNDPHPRRAPDRHSIPISSGEDSDDELPRRPSKKPRTGSVQTSNKQVRQHAESSTARDKPWTVDDAGQEHRSVPEDEDEEARETEEGNASISRSRNGTDGTALPAEVRRRFLDQINYWDRRTPHWASRPQSNDAEIKCCSHVVQRKPCRWHREDEDGPPNHYRACEICAKSGKVCAIVTGADEVLVLPLSDQDHERFYPGRTGFVKEDVGYWVRELDE